MRKIIIAFLSVGMLYPCLAVHVDIPDGTTSIEARAYQNRSDITSVTIPDSVTSIGEGAFRGCSGLKSVTIPNSVTNIGDSAFSGCSGLVSAVVPACVCASGRVSFTFPDSECLQRVEIAEGVTSIGYAAFTYCDDLTSVTIPNSVTSIGVCAFTGCDRLASVTIPNSVTSIEAWAFSGCDLLTSVTIPNSVTSIGYAAFSGCEDLVSVTISDRVTSISEEAFRDCGSLASIKIPKSVTTIGASAFKGCTSLASITIPDSVTSIGDYAFKGCVALPSIAIPSSVENIGANAFANCSVLRRVVIDSAAVASSRALASLFPDAYTELADIALGVEVAELAADCFVGCTSLRCVAIDSASVAKLRTLKSLFPDAYAKLTDIALGAEVTILADGFFDGCVALMAMTPDWRGIGKQVGKQGLWIENGRVLAYVGEAPSEVTIPDGVTGIAASAFADQAALESLTLPDGVTDIGNSAFSGCTRLVSANIPASVMNVGADAFAGCAALRRLTLDSAAIAMSWTLKSLLSDSCAGLKSLVVGEGVTSFADGFFDACESLAAISLPSTLEAFGDSDVRAVGARAGKRGLWVENGWVLGYIGDAPASVEIPDGVTGIASSAFEGQAALVSVSFPSSLRSIGVRAFALCTSLEQLDLPDGVERIDDAAFQDCTWLQELSFPFGLRHLGDFAFANCTSLSNLACADGVVEIGEGAFSNCWRMLSVSLPSSLETVGANAFYGCGYIEEATVPTHVKPIAELLSDVASHLADIAIAEGETMLVANTFAGCAALTRIVLPPSLAEIPDGAFRGCASLASVMIPEGVTVIGADAFRGTSLASVEIPSTVTAIGAGAFAELDLLTELTLPASLQSVGDKAFSGCSGLSELVLPSCLTNIGTRAFAGLDKLTAVAIPPSVTVLGAGAFAACPNIQTVSLPGNVATVAAVFPNAYATALVSASVTGTAGDLKEGLFEGCAALKSVAVPTCVTNIGSRAFRDCAAVSSVTIPEGVTAIGADAFRGTSLASVEIPSTVTAIGAGAFAGLDLLTELTLPAALQSVGDGAFADCSRLASLVIPAGVTELEANVFNGCAALKAVYFLSATAPTVAAETYAGTPEDLVSYVVKGSTGWDGLATSKALPQAWPEANGRAIAWWEPNVFEVTFLGNGGEPESQGVSETTGATYVMPSEPPVRVGATFAGWWTEPVNGGQVKVTTKVELTRPHTLYAHWRGHVYEIAFDLNGAAGALSSLSMEYGEAKALPSCTVRRRDFDFAGWALSPDADAADFADGAEVLDLTDEDGATVTLYAVWTPRTWTAADCLNAEGLSFASAGDADWTADYETSHDGVASMRSGVLGTAPEGETVHSTLKTSVTGNGTLSFWWKVICEPSDPETGDLFDYLELTVDGVRPSMVAPIAGDAGDWAFVTVRIEGGAAAHEVSWSFVKDDWDEAAFADVAWVDEVTWTPDPVTLTFAANGATGGDAPEVIVSGCGETVTLPGASSLVCEGCSFVGWSDGVRTYAAGAAFVVGAADVAFIAVWREMSLGDVLNAPTLAFATDGDAAWTFDATVSHDDVASLRSGAVAAGQTSWVETSVTNAGTLAFWWKVDGLLYRGKAANYVEVAVDGVAVTNATVTDWASVSVEVSGSGAHTVRWTYRQTRTQTEGEACAWLDEVTWTPAAPVTPTVDGDDGASVTGDATSGWTVTPSEDATEVVVTIPSGVDAAKVTVRVAPDTKRVTPNGAAVKVVRGDADITDYLNIPAANASGVIDLNAATVKEEIAKEPLDAATGAVFDFASPSKPSLTTAPTREGLVYRLKEGATLEAMAADTTGETKIGDGTSWTPTLSVMGGTSGFYTIQVTK